MRTTRNLFLLALLFLTGQGFSQGNFSGFNYQAVVRNAGGQPLPNQVVGVEVTITAGMSGSYVETHSVTSDDHGLIALVMGQGTPSGSSSIATFSAIDWSAGEVMGYAVAVDITGGTNYAPLGSGTFQAVPFAMHALGSDGDPVIVDQDGDGWAAPYDFNDTNPNITSVWTTNGYDVSNPTGGNVGIGTSSPVFDLDARGSNPDDGAVLQLGNSDQSQFLRLFGGRQNDPEPFVMWKAGSPLRFATDASGFSEQMRISSDGNVGIGTTTPSAHKLEVKADAQGIAQTSADGSISMGTYVDNAFGAYIQTNTNDPLNFTTNNGASQMTLTTAGDVGIGTANPAAKLDVAGTVKITDGTQGAGKVLTSDANGQATWTAPAVASSYWNPYGNSIFNNNSAGVGIGTTAPQCKLHVENTGGSEIMRVASSASTGWLSLVENGSRRGILAYTGQGITLLADGAKYINFQTDGATRMSIAPAGRVGIGSQTPTAKLHVSHADGELGLSIQNSSDNDFWSFYNQTSGHALQLYHNGSLRGAFNATSGVYTNISDRSLKKDIEPLGVGMLSKIMQLEPSKYHFKDQGDDDTRMYFGLIAQDLAQVFPDLATFDDKLGLYTVSYSELIPVLIAAVQEQQAEIGTLRGDTAKKDEVIDGLRAQVEANTALMKQIQSTLHAQGSK